MRHLYLDDLSRNKGKGKLIAGRGVAMSVESAPDPTSIVCHNCGNQHRSPQLRQRGTLQSGCAVPGKTCDKRNNGHARKSRKSRGTARDTTKKRCSLHKTTSHNDADCFKKEASRPNEGGVFSATALGAHSLHSESDEKPAIKFDDDFDGGFQF